MPDPIPPLFASPEESAAFLVACQTVGCPLSQDQLALTGRFYTLLAATNQQVNLTRLSAPQDFLCKLVLDSLTLVPHLPQGARVLDIGSGAGVPAIPLAIVRADLSLTAVDAVRKKCDFINQAAGELGLPKLTARHGRCEEMARAAEHREQYDAVTAKAVASLAVLAEWGLPFLRPGGHLLALKGPGLPEEIREAEALCETLGGEVEAVVPYENPVLSGAVLAILRKVGTTPPQYPRNPGKLKKRKKPV